MHKNRREQYSKQKPPPSQGPTTQLEISEIFCQRAGPISLLIKHLRVSLSYHSLRFSIKSARHHLIITVSSCRCLQLMNQLHRKVLGQRGQTGVLSSSTTTECRRGAVAVHRVTALLRTRYSSQHTYSGTSPHMSVRFDCVLYQVIR